MSCLRDNRTDIVQEFADSVSCDAVIRLGNNNLQQRRPKEKLSLRSAEWTAEVSLALLIIQSSKKVLDHLFFFRSLMNEQENVSKKEEKNNKNRLELFNKKALSWVKQKLWS